MEVRITTLVEVRFANLVNGVNLSVLSVLAVENINRKGAKIAKDEIAEYMVGLNPN